MHPLDSRAIGCSRLARAALGFLVASFAAITQVAAERVIGSGQEQRVLALFAPAGLGEEVVPGYRLMDVAIGRHEIALRLDPVAGGDARSAVIRAELRSRGESLVADARTVGETPSFLVVVSGAVADPERAALDALVARINPNDDGRFWVDVAVESSVAEYERDGDVGLGLVVRWAVFALVLATLVVSVALRRRRPREPSEHVE